MICARFVCENKLIRAVIAGEHLIVQDVQLTFDVWKQQKQERRGL
jgi:hypothetical protein